MGHLLGDLNIENDQKKIIGIHSVLKSYRASTSVYRAVSKFVVLLPSDGGPRRRVRGDDTRSARDENLAAGTSFYTTLPIAAVVLL